MVQRGKVTDERGRLWVSGALSAEEYFVEARRSARRRAQQAVSERLARGARPRTVSPSAR